VKWILRCSFLHVILELQSETRHPQSPLATILLRSSRSSRSGPKVVATNRLDQAQRPIGHLPIMGRTLPITLEEPTEEVGDRRDQGSDRAAADRERGLDKREDDPEQGVIDMIGCLVGRSPRSGTQGLPPHFTFLPGAPHGTSARYAGWLL
jgi:hypothetical protein